jgi:integrase
MSRAATGAGLPKGTTSHDLRHHYASVLLVAGESVVAVAERLGHEDASLVLSTYGHLMPDSDDRTRRAVDAAWDAASTPCAPDVPGDARSFG